MNKEVLLALIDKDIKELAILNKGFAENEAVSPTILGLAKSKAENILAGLHALSELQLVSKPEVATDATTQSEVEPQSEAISDIKPEMTDVCEDASMEEPKPVDIEIPKTVAPTTTERAEPSDATEIQPKHSLNEMLNAQSHSLNDALAKNAEPSLANVLSNSKIDDLKTALSLAERFRFQRELFLGNGEKLNTTLAALNNMKTEEEALAYLTAFGWDEKNSCVSEFKQLIHRKFV